MKSTTSITSTIRATFGSNIPAGRRGRSRGPSPGQRGAPSEAGADMVAMPYRTAMAITCIIRAIRFTMAIRRWQRPTNTHSRPRL
jgi:hypothetical protein